MVRSMFTYSWRSNTSEAISLATRSNEQSRASCRDLKKEHHIDIGNLCPKVLCLEISEFLHLNYWNWRIYCNRHRTGPRAEGWSSFTSTQCCVKLPIIWLNYSSWACCSPATRLDEHDLKLALFQGDTWEVRRTPTSSATHSSGRGSRYGINAINMNFCFWKGRITYRIVQCLPKGKSLETRHDQITCPLSVISICIVCLFACVFICLRLLVCLLVCLFVCLFACVLVC